MNKVAEPRTVFERRGKAGFAPRRRAKRGTDSSTADRGEEGELPA